jgi:hypothetical protein
MDRSLADSESKILDDLIWLGQTIWELTPIKLMQLMEENVNKIFTIKPKMETIM